MIDPIEFRYVRRNPKLAEILHLAIEKSLALQCSISRARSWSGPFRMTLVFLRTALLTSWSAWL